MAQKRTAKKKSGDSEDSYSGPLQQGDKGPEVTELQGFLREAGLKVVTDGVFGPETARAVQSFQQRYGLGPTGIADEDTRRLLTDVVETPETLPENAIDGPAEAGTRPSDVAGREKESSRVWIFQALPDVWDLREKLAPGGEVAWRIRHHFRDIMPGDLALFWQAGEERGCYGWGRVSAPPYFDPTEPRKKGRLPLYRVPIKIEAPFDPPVLGEQIAADPALRDLTILRNPQGSSFRTSHQEATAMLALIERVTGVAISITEPTPPIGGDSDPIERLRGGTSDHLASDAWTVEDALGYRPYAHAIAAFLGNRATKPPVTISIQAPWGGGKTSLMKMIQRELDEIGFVRSWSAYGSDRPEQGQLSLRDFREYLRSLMRKDTEEEVPIKQASTADAAEDDDVQTKVVGGSIVNGEGTLTQEQVVGDEDIQFASVWFNAWRYQSTQQVWAGLADAIVRQVSSRLGAVDREKFFLRLHLRRLDLNKIRLKVWESLLNAFWSKFRYWFASLTSAAAVGSSAVAFSLAPTGWVFPIVGSYAAAVIIAAAIQWFRADKEVKGQPAKITLSEYLEVPDYRANLGFVHHVDEDIRRVLDLLPSKDGKPSRLVIFIDDLDRCAPTKVAAVFEALNLFLAGEFPNCIMIIGMDTELVAAALEEAHSNVIRHLPADAKGLGVGRRYMDKFIQLPFVIPPLDDTALDNYMRALLQLVRPGSDVGSEHDVAEEPSATLDSTEGDRVGVKESTQETKERIEEMVSQFASDEEVEGEIREARREFSRNPREFKRFLNSLRFSYAVRVARQVKGLEVPTLAQLRRWIRITLEWPEAARWLRRSYSRWEDDRESEVGETSAGLRLEQLEDLGARSEVFDEWLFNASENLGLKQDDHAWIADEGLFRFFRREGVEITGEDRLSGAAGTGFW